MPPGGTRPGAPGRTHRPGRRRRRASRRRAASLRRLNRIHRLDAASQTLDLDAGVTLEQAQALAAEAGLDPGIDLAARGSASVGGLVATNAGGIRAFRFGTMRQRVLGLEAVLADGSVYSDLRGLLKNTTGYDLKQLFVGAEGTLGIVTRAVLRLEPLQRPGATALLGLPDVDAAIAIAARLRREHAERLFACEILWHDYLQCTAAPMGDTAPSLAPCPLYLLVELAEDRHLGCRRGAHHPAGRLLRGWSGGRRPARRQRNPAPGHLAPARRLRRGHPRRRRQPVLRRIAAGASPSRLRRAHPAAPGRPRWRACGSSSSAISSTATCTSCSPPTSCCCRCTRRWRKSSTASWANALA
ncbi:FAD-binding oxidoreductase [Pseudomonas aeruginosa]|nr:FAD-binding oxidoreductase [Pseudomonas aeruginosa]